MKKALIIIAIIAVVCVAAFACYKLTHKEVLSNDGVIGKAEFQNLTHESGFGLDIDAGEFQLEVGLTSGLLNVKITDGKNVLYEQTQISAATTETINIEKQGYYFMMLSGKNATGYLKYPVATSSNTPSLVEKEDDDTKAMLEELLKTPDGVTVSQVLFDFFKKDNEDIEELRIDKLKIYTKEEIEKDDILKTYTIGEKDVVFDASYSIHFKEASDDMMAYTAASGDIEGDWVTNKFNCGICVYDEETESYTLEHFGTAF